MDTGTRLLRLIGADDIRESPERFFMRDRCGFFICTQGAGRLSFFNRDHPVSRGCVALFHPFVKVTFRDVSDDIAGFWAMRDLSGALQVINQVLGVENIEAIKTEPVVGMEKGMFDTLLAKIDRYLDECDALEHEIATTEVCRPICRALLTSHDDMLMLDILNRYFLTRSRPVRPTTGHDIVFQKFMMDLQENYTTHRDTMFYARRSSLSPKYFSTVIRNVSGAPPLEWIVQTVISVAGNLLLDTRKSIKDIAAELGFPSQAFFCAYFKRYTTLSPKTYRARHGLRQPTPALNDQPDITPET